MAATELTFSGMISELTNDGFVIAFEPDCIASRGCVLRVLKDGTELFRQTIDHRAAQESAMDLFVYSLSRVYGRIQDLKAK